VCRKPERAQKRTDAASRVSIAPLRPDAAYRQATEPRDEASEELREAWDRAYSRNPNASDAWDHAIKAVELLYIAIVCPTKDKANLGSVAGHLKAHPNQFTVGLESTGIGGVETVGAEMPWRRSASKIMALPRHRACCSVTNESASLASRHRCARRWSMSASRSGRAVSPEAGYPPEPGPVADRHGYGRHG
jgi:hypothetical protein